MLKIFVAMWGTPWQKQGQTDMALTANFKFRTSAKLVRRASKVRRALGQNRSQFGRQALQTYVETKERELGLVAAPEKQIGGAA